MSTEAPTATDLHMQRLAELGPITTRINELTYDILPARILIPLGAVGTAALFGRFARDPSSRKASLAGAALLAAGTLIEVSAYRHFTTEDQLLRHERTAVHTRYDQRIAGLGD
jgi:hypothetical protein